MGGADGGTTAALAEGVGLPPAGSADAEPAGVTVGNVLGVGLAPGLGDIEAVADADALAVALGVGVGPPNWVAVGVWVGVGVGVGDAVGFGVGVGDGVGEGVGGALMV